jgi:hypothetical protein
MFSYVDFIADFLKNRYKILLALTWKWKVWEDMPILQPCDGDTPGDDGGDDDGASRDNAKGQSDDDEQPEPSHSPWHFRKSLQQLQSPHKSLSRSALEEADTPSSRNSEESFGLTWANLLSQNFIIT